MFALATAASFYGGMIWIGKHFRPEFKQELSNWLDGGYESTWTSQFGRLFDTVFGERHLSAKRLVRSAIASVFAVLILYVLFAHVLGVLGARTFGSMSLWQVVLLGAVINIVPDYLSLVETRWLLHRFERVRSLLGQLLLLAADLVFTAAIILAGIFAYTWLVPGIRVPSAVEIVALFSVFAIFFYSTFLTSVWAWLYCLSTWFVRLTRLGLRKILDVEKTLSSSSLLSVLPLSRSAAWLPDRCSSRNEADSPPVSTTSSAVSIWKRVCLPRALLTKMTRWFISCLEPAATKSPTAIVATEWQCSLTAT